MNGTLLGGSSSSDFASQRCLISKLATKWQSQLLLVSSLERHLPGDTLRAEFMALISIALAVTDGLT